MAHVKVLEMTELVQEALANDKAARLVLFKCLAIGFHLKLLQITDTLQFRL